MTSTMLLALGLLSVFLAVVIVLATIGVLTAERQQVSKSLNAIRTLEGSVDTREAQPAFRDRVLLPASGRLAALGRRVTGAGKVEALRRKLEIAGSPQGWDADRVLAAKALGLIVGFAISLALVMLLGLSLTMIIAIVAGLSAVGYFAPNIWLYQRGYNRTEQMQRDLPDSMDMLTISVEAGLAFDAAVSQVARNTEGPLADEFFRVLQEMQIGKGRSEALRALGERSNVPELRTFTAAMVQADAFGIPIAQVLRVQAKEMRVKRRQRAEEKAQKVPVKILFPLIFCILPTLFIVILGPGVLQIIDFFSTL